MKNKTKPSHANDELRQAEAAKTSRLRSLRLAKEAADKEAAAREAAANPPARRRARGTTPREEQPPQA